MNYNDIKNHLLQMLIAIEHQPEVVGLNLQEFAKANRYNVRTVATAMNELEMTGLTERI